MKTLKIFLVVSLALTSIVSTAQNRTKRLVFQQSYNAGSFNYGYVTTATTDSNNAVNIDTLSISDDEAGVLEVSMVGFNKDSGAVTGIKLIRYWKSGGTLTLGSATNDLASATDTNLGSATWSIAKVGENIAVTATGEDDVTITWRAVIKRNFVKLE